MTDQISGRPQIAPILLAKDNFTPPSRTPWGGIKISEIKGLIEKRVGESWELSLGPEFPSVAEGGVALSELVARAPLEWLGSAGETAVLVKLLDAREPLSVQIHPSDDGPVAADECGKPEAWYIVKAEPGAGLYLGLEPGTTREAFEKTLRDGGDLSRLLPFVPVEPGDFFVIEAGTPHAIGAGITLIEPQRVGRKKRGVTYRYWDWNRRYDASGALDPSGTPRALHIEQALAVTRWHDVSGPGFLERISLRDRPGAGAERRTLASPSGAVTSDVFVIDRLSGTGEVEFPAQAALRALTVVEGAVELAWEGGSLAVPKGRSAAVPASAVVSSRLDHALALVSSVRP
jgi:mannose-6-phosphate isomerase